MKKITICLILAVILSNCEIRVKEAKAEYHLMNTGESTQTVYAYKTFSNMRYLFTTTYHGGSTAVNLTKDSLEVELLKKQLAK